MDAHHRFDPGSVGTFRVLDREYDRANRTATLRYAFDDGERFEETVTFENDPGPGAPFDREGFERALLHLHIAAGTSYYKAAAPPVVAIEHDGLTPDELAFHHRLYDDGLREFAVTNGLPVPRPVELRAARPPFSSPPARPGVGTPGDWWSPSGAARTRWCSSRPSGRSVPGCSPSTPTP